MVICKNWHSHGVEHVGWKVPPKRLRWQKNDSSHSQRPTKMNMMHKNQDAKKKTHWRKVDVFPRLAHKKQKYCFGFKIELCDQKLFVCVCVYVGASSNECRLRRLVVQYFHIYKKQNFVSAQTDGVEEAHEVKQKKIRRSLRRWKKNGCCSVFSTFVTSRCFGKMQTEFFLLGGLLRKFGLCSHCEEKSILVEIEGR